MLRCRAINRLFGLIDGGSHPNDLLLRCTFIVVDTFNCSYVILRRDNNLVFRFYSLDNIVGRVPDGELLEILET